MRRFVSLFVIAALLSVSSVPLVSAVACEMPAAAGVSAADGLPGDMQDQHDHHAMTMHDGMDSMPSGTAMSQTDVAVPDIHAGHDHSAALTGDWQHCRIECGCGCHRSIDSLPHLLAPHSADGGFHPEIVAVERAVSLSPARPSARLLPVSSPPPDFL